jgi:hypothetical protein
MWRAEGWGRPAKKSQPATFGDWLRMHNIRKLFKIVRRKLTRHFFKFKFS